MATQFDFKNHPEPTLTHEQFGAVTRAMDISDDQLGQTLGLSGSRKAAANSVRQMRKGSRRITGPVVTALYLMSQDDWPEWFDPAWIARKQ